MDVGSDATAHSRRISSLKSRARATGDLGTLCPVEKLEGSGEWQDWLEDDGEDQETTFAEHEEFSARKSLMMTAMKDLNEREQRILQARRLAEPPLTLEDLASEFGVSRERIRQIEVRAFEKLQKAVRDQAAAMNLLPKEDMAGLLPA